MTSQHAVIQREILRAKEAELLAVLRNRDGLATEAEPDFFDQIQSAAARALVVQSLDRQSMTLRDVRAALARIADGTYGRCAECDEAISPKRLAAVPWTSLCLACQEQADRDRQERIEEFAFATRS